MKIRDLFVHEVTRNIPPVVYFHEQSPERLASEVSEYIITGGYRDNDPRHQRVSEGIHEAYVKLFRKIREGLDRKGGPELPASWISGFYGSGKSSFAKLLGLSLDGAKLPDGSALSEALLRRDDSPKAPELREAWTALTKDLQARAVVFDIGGVARDEEHIHSAALRQVQKRLGYCPRSNLVAEFELKLESDGQWDAFAKAASKALGKPWSEAMRDALAEEHFSHALHVLDPQRYVEPLSWIDARAGARSGAGTSVSEVVDAIGRMLENRAPKATIFLVIDEVSQYVHNNEERMLALQSFVSELGQQLRGRVWLLATGQQKLEDQSETQVLGKLKDRFPPGLRVHLTNTNIRDVIHKRLLQKRADREAELQRLFREHRADLVLHGFDCEHLAESDFVEVYPMLPGHVDLLLDITSALRLRSTRVQSDDQTLRGLLQLLGELFRERKLAEREVGELVTLDEIFEVQRTALDVDLQNSLARIQAHELSLKDPFVWRVARVVALLQQIQEQRPTTDELVARCLYARLGQGTQLQSVRGALEKLRNENLLAYSEKHGFKIQSAAGQEWQKERDDLGVPKDNISSMLREQLKTLLAEPERPKYKGRPFAWSAWYGDDQYIKDDHIVVARAQDADVTVDFRCPWAREKLSADRWVVESDQGELRNRIVWVSGDPNAIEQLVRDFARSKQMVKLYGGRKSSLSHDRQRLLLEEETRHEELEKRVRDAVASLFLGGTLWFRGRPTTPLEKGSSFATVLLEVGQETLPKLYPSCTDIAVTAKELEQLLAKELSGPSPKFLSGQHGLGILDLDNGRYVASCGGAVPTMVLQTLEQAKGLTGGDLLSQFVRPPYGWPADVVKACIAGLLRATKIIVQPTQGGRLTSVRDGGVRDLFDKDRDFRLAQFFPAAEGTITARDRTAICKFFKERLDAEVDRENDAIADAVWEQFPRLKARSQEVEGKLSLLGIPVPTTLQELQRSIEKSQSSRRVEDIILSLKQALQALIDGVAELHKCEVGLTDTAVAQVRDARSAAQGELAQLVEIDRCKELQDEATKLQEQLASPRPWIEIQATTATIERLRKHYIAVRSELLGKLTTRVEQARQRVQGRGGYAELGAKEAHAVMRVFHNVLPHTATDALEPTLITLRDSYPERLRRAEEEADALLDDALEEKRSVPVKALKLELRGREVSTEEELDALLKELKERIGAQLRQGVRVRLD